MHVLLIHQVFVRPDDPGGTRHFELAAQLVEAGHRVTILASSQSYQTGAKLTRVRREVLRPGLEIRRCWVAGSFTRSFPSRALGFVSFIFSSFLAGVGTREVDLVWGTSPPLPQVLTAWAVARVKRVPWVFEIRDLWPAFAIQVGVLRSRVLIAVSQALERFLYRRADRLVVNSPGFIPHLLARGVPPDRVTLVPNGVDPRMFDPLARGEGFREQAGLAGKFVALYAGAHGLSNDLGVVLDAAERLREEERIAFVFLGDGQDKPRLVAEAERRGLSNIRFLPALPKSRMAEALAAADCGIAILKPIPLYATTYPNKVFDYMAAGRPVVLAIGGEIRAVVERAQAGVAVPPGDAVALAQAVRLLASDPARARQLGENGRRCVVAEFDRADIGRQFEGVLRDTALAGRRQSCRSTPAGLRHSGGV